VSAIILSLYLYSCATAFLSNMSTIPDVLAAVVRKSVAIENRQQKEGTSRPGI
jgi:hypothetical protein